MELEENAGAAGAGRMRKPNARSTYQTQQAMDLQTLDTWLEHLKPAPKVDGVSMLDGYLAAIVVGPCSIPPNEWFFDLLGARGNIATAQGKRLAAIMAIVERFNAIGEILSVKSLPTATPFSRPIATPFRLDRAPRDAAYACW
jgi:hypothetical protein